MDIISKHLDSRGSDTVVDSVNVKALHFVKWALTESKLLEHLLHFRESSVSAASVNKKLSPSELARRAPAMMALKNASEHFNSLLRPVSQEQLRELQVRRLDKLLASEYWHSILLANAQPRLRRSELDWLCSTLSYVSQIPPITGVDQDKPNTNANAADNCAAPVQASFYDAEKSANTKPKPLNQVENKFGVISGFIAGMSALLLLVLAVKVFPLELPGAIQNYLSIGSIPYRLLMIVVLLTLTTSCFFMLSRLLVTGDKELSPIETARHSKGIFVRLFDIGASPRRIVAGALGPAFLGLGLGISISAGFGTFGFSVLLDGIYQTFQVPFWVSQTAITIGCYLLAWLWGRVPLGLGTITTLLLIGPAISFGAGLPPENLGFIGDLLAFIVGLLLFAGGISLAAAAALGPDGVTALSLAAERTHNWPVSRATFLWDITAIAAGMILGGNFGIATLIGLFTVPYLIHMFIPPLRKILHPLSTQQPQSS